MQQIISVKVQVKPAFMHSVLYTLLLQELLKPKCKLTELHWPILHEQKNNPFQANILFGKESMGVLGRFLRVQKKRKKKNSKQADMSSKEEMIFNWYGMVEIEY